MKRTRPLFWSLTWLFLVCPFAQAEQTVISDTFNGADKAPVENRWPDTKNLPGVTWSAISSGKGHGCVPALGTVPDIPTAPMAYLTCSGNSTGAIVIPLSNQGTYIKPQRFTIYADLASFPGNAHPALGFYSALPSESVEKNFTGLKLVCGGSDAAANGTLVLYQNGTPSTSVKYTGTFDLKKLHRLSYDVDTSTGAISNVKLEDSSSDYSVFHTTAFTNAATAYAGVVAITTFGRDTQIGVANFNIIADKNEPAIHPNITPPATPTEVTAVPGDSRRREDWTWINLSWEKVPGASSYNIYRSTTPGANPANLLATDVTADNYRDQGEGGVTYYYKIQSTNPNGTSDYSKEVNATPVNPLYRDKTAYPPLQLTWNENPDVKQVKGVFPHPLLTQRVVVTTRNGLFLSDDSGRTWQPLPEASVEKVGLIQKVEFHPTDTDTFYLASKTKGIWVTTDAGKTFHQLGSKANGMAADETEDIIVYPADTFHLTLLAVHGTAAGGISRSRDAGKTWDILNPDFFFYRLLARERDSRELYLFGSTKADPDIHNLYVCSTLGEPVVETMHDSMLTDMAFSLTLTNTLYVATSDSGLYRVDNAQFTPDVKPIGAKDESWSSVATTWGSSADALNLCLYNPSQLGLIFTTDDLATTHAYSGLPVGAFIKEGAAVRPNANGTVFYAAINESLLIGRPDATVPNVNVTPAAFQPPIDTRKSLEEEITAFSDFLRSSNSHISKAATELCQRLGDVAAFYHENQITITARLPLKPTPPTSVTVDLSRFGGTSATPMYDDGKHDDGAANDGVYGFTFCYHPVNHERYDWRTWLPGRVAMGVSATFADGTHQGAVGVVGIYPKIESKVFWGRYHDIQCTTEGDVTTESVPNPEKLHKGVTKSLSIHAGHGPWSVTFDIAPWDGDITGYQKLSFGLRVSDGTPPKKLYLQLCDNPTLSAPTTTDRVDVLQDGIPGGLNSEYKTVSIPIDKLLGKQISQFQTTKLHKIIISGDGGEPVTLLMDWLSLLPPTGDSSP